MPFQGTRVPATGPRHTRRTLTEELRTAPELTDGRMGYEDGSVQVRYAHVTPDMRADVVRGLTQQWETALGTRRAGHGQSHARAITRGRCGRSACGGVFPGTGAGSQGTRPEPEPGPSRFSDLPGLPGLPGLPDRVLRPGRTYG